MRRVILYGVWTLSMSGRSGDAAFVLNFDRNLDLDAGVTYMFATLASVSLWNGTGSQLVSCPIQENLYFGIRDLRGLSWL